MQTSYLIDYLARFGHFLFGIAWIGMLYYFNFVQAPYLKEADPSAKVDVSTKLLPKALWWFRWGAMLTLLTGLILLYNRASAISIDITIGATLGTLMFLNVWLIIWPNQRRVIASNEAVAQGYPPDAEAAGAAARSTLASRTNTLFSIPMLFFMGSSAHMSHGLYVDAATNQVLVAAAIIGALELNAIFGKLGAMASVKGVIVSGFVLTAALWAAVSWV